MKLYEIDTLGTCRMLPHSPQWIAGVCAAAVENYRRHGFLRPWISYLAETGHAVIGTCSFSAPPHGDEVEITFQTFPDYEGEGFANEMARRLIELARRAHPGITVTVRTLCGEDNPTISIVKHFGFVLRGVVDVPEEGERLEWALPATTPIPPGKAKDRDPDVVR